MYYIENGLGKKYKPLSVMFSLAGLVGWLENIVLDEKDSSAVSDLLVDNSEPKWYDAESIDDVLDEVEKTPLKENIEVELIKEEQHCLSQVQEPSFDLMTWMWLTH